MGRLAPGQDISGSADLKLEDILELLNSYLAVQTDSGASVGHDEDANEGQWRDAPDELPRK